jgi:CheY-like chemotaxis protein/anti-sigma regulatory factor (Ser/Thr protein kinase)
MAGSGPTTERTTVLVVDDDPDQRFVLRRLLRRAGITEVHEAADGDEALEVARREALDLVILDLAMPGRSGIDVLPELRGSVGRAPIVVLSNLARRRWEAEVLDLGAVGFVEKRTPNDRLIGDVLAVAALLDRLGDRLGVDLEQSPAAPGTARRFVRSSLTDIDEAALDAVELLTSELVTNAVIHAGSQPHLALVLHADHVRVEVHDDDPNLPARRTPDEARPGGRGLLLLDQVASDWGAEATEGGKVVWFEVPRRTGGAA